MLVLRTAPSVVAAAVTGRPSSASWHRACADTSPVTGPADGESLDDPPHAGAAQNRRRTQT